MNPKELYDGQIDEIRSLLRKGRILPDDYRVKIITQRL